MDHMGDGTLPDHRVVQAQIRVDLAALPLDSHVQHHPLFRLEVPVLQLPQGLQLPGLQLRDEAQAPHVDAQHRNLVQGHQLGEMQDGAVPAEGNQQVGAFQLRRQGPGLVVPIGPVLLVLERGTHHRLEAHLPQNGVCPAGGLHAPVSVGVGAEDDLFHGLPPSPCSFRVW